MKYLIRDSTMSYYDNWHEIETDNLINFLYKKYRGNDEVYESANRGERRIEILIKSPDNSLSFYEAKYSWYTDYLHDWKTVVEFYIDQITEVKFRFPSKNREWLIL